MDEIALFLPYKTLLGYNFRTWPLSSVRCCAPYILFKHHEKLLHRWKSLHYHSLIGGGRYCCSLADSIYFPVNYSIAACRFQISIFLVWACIFAYKFQVCCLFAHGIYCIGCEKRPSLASCLSFWIASMIYLLLTNQLLFGLVIFLRIATP